MQCAPIWLSRAIYQHIFSRLAGAQFADCITCLTWQIFFFVFNKQLLFRLFIHAWFWSCLYMFHSFAIFLSQCVPLGSVELSTNTFLIAWPAHNLLIALPASLYKFICVSISVDSCILASLFMFELEYVWICFIPVFHSFAIFPSQYAPMGSAERPWTTTQKSWLHHLGVQEQSKFPFVCGHTFLFV